jgi:Tol biopolymer transport system component
MAPKARLVVLTVLAAAAAGITATCGPEPTGSEPDQLDATLTVSAQVGDRVAAVSVEVSAPDIRTPIVANIPVTDGVASGTMTVPAGSDRLTTVHAFDDNAIETHRGAKTVNLKEGDNQVVEIALDPLTGQEPIVATVATYTVTLEPADTAIDVLETAQLSATVTDASGHVVQNPALDWGSTNPVVAGVDDNGLVTGGHAGVTSIVVTYLGVVATTRVVVAGEAVEKIAFESDRDGETHSYVMNADGSDLTRLASGTGFSDFNPAWSPDGSRIAVGRQPEGTSAWDIYLLAADGSGATNLTNNPAHYRFQAWSPDGTRLAFIIDTGTTDIYTINADGSGLVNLTNDPTILSRYPAWSPDGTRIAFDAEYDDGSTVRRVIYVMNADGSGRVRVTNHEGDDSRPVWSPDGSRIAFDNQPDHGRAIYTVNPDGSGLARLSPADSIATSPAWSPDGTRVAFNNYGNTLYANVAVVNADGTGLVNLTNIPGVSQGSPQWSPDGSRIVYVSYQDGNGEVYIMSADGTGQTNLTNDPAQEGDPRWARTLVFPPAGS